MSLRLYLIVMSLVCACSWIAWMIVLYAIDPTKSGFLGFVLFFLALFMACLSTVTLIGTIIRFWLRKQEVVYRLVVRSLRQGIILTCLFTLSLILMGMELFVWWVLLLLVIIASLCEMAFSEKPHTT